MANADRPGKLAGLAAQIRAAQEQPITASDAASEPAGATIPPPREGSAAPQGRRARKATAAPSQDPAPDQLPKSKDEQFVQVTLFLRRAHYAEAQNRLRTARTMHRAKQDFSDVADALVAGWLDGRFQL